MYIIGEYGDIEFLLWLCVMIGMVLIFEWEMVDYL